MKLLRPYQQSALDAIYSYFKVRDGNPVCVVPTGGGKSLIMAAFIERALKWDGVRILVTADRKELIQQNYNEIRELLPGADIGIFSAGLNRKELDNRVTVAGIQSIVNALDKIHKYDVVLVDEVHMFPKGGDGRYQTILTKLRKLKPTVRLLGLSATPFRTSSGMITEGDDRVFTDIVYDVKIDDLIDQGFLCKLRSKVSEIQPDLTLVDKSQGDYTVSQLQEEMTRDERKVEAAIDEIMFLGQDRKSWIIFCTGVQHVEMVEEMLTRKGIMCASITGETDKRARDVSINMFKRGEIQALVNCNVLTTGFNAPNTDLIVMLRPTKSPGLYVQMVGRGSRIAEGKTDCLILDYAKNISEHGPIIEVIPPATRNENTKKAHYACKNCGEVMSPLDKECGDCGAPVPDKIEQEFKAAHDRKAGDKDIMGATPPQWHKVMNVRYNVHEKPDKPISLRVTYECLAGTFSEWICINHQSVKNKAITWLHERGVLDVCDAEFIFIKCACGHHFGKHEGDSIFCEKCDEKIRMHKAADPKNIVHNLIHQKMKEPEEILVSKKGKYNNIERVLFEAEPVEDEIPY